VLVCGGGGWCVGGGVGVGWWVVWGLCGGGVGVGGELGGVGWRWEGDVLD